MRDLNFTYIIAGMVFACIMYIATEQLTVSIILGVGVAFGGNRRCVYRGNKDGDAAQKLKGEEKV